MRRRIFLGTAGAAMSATPSNTLRLGLIGCGGRGRFLAAFMSRFPEVRVLAVSDPLAPRMEEAAASQKKVDGAPVPDLVADYRRILDRRDIDGVLIANTHHWHSLPFLEACQARKSIYVEKPLAFSVGEGRAMVNAAKQAGVVAMMGTQQQGVPQFQRAIELVRSGTLGPVPLIECWNLHPYGPRTGRHPPAPPPPGYDWNRWLGPAPDAPFQQSRLRSNWWFDYSGGMMTDWAVHHFDIICRAMRSYDPEWVECSGGKTVTTDDADCPDLIHATWKFPGFTATYRYRGFNFFHPIQARPRDHGIVFYGTKASVVVDRYGLELWDENKPHQKLEEMFKPETEAAWYRAFVDAAIGRAPVPLDLEWSHRATTVCHVANIAYHTGRRLQWNGQSEQFPNDKAANRYLMAPRRKGFELPPS